MNGFVIYSMGDHEFLRLALLGLSHAFEQGAASLAKIGLMLSLLAILWQGIWNPGKIEFKNFFMSFFMIFILFGKQVEVVLIHNDGAGADSMPPIPIGIALGATLATNFGHNLANSMRDFYHTTYVPGSIRTGDYRLMLSSDGHGETAKVAGNGLTPLRELMKLKFDGQSDPFNSIATYQAANTSTGNGATKINYGSSIQNYIRDCVLKDIYNKNSVQEVNESAIANVPFAWNEMQVSYNGWATNIKVNAGRGWEQVGCGDAYTQLSGVLLSMRDIVNKKSGLDGEVNEELAKQGSAMIRQGSEEAYKIQLNGLMEYHFKKAKTLDRFASQAELMSSQAEFDAMEARRMSSAVQYSLWAEMATPLITYIEAFVFLIGPLMPFVAAFGEKGLGMLVKYFFMLIWVNTWPLLQVGVNMYLQHYINKASFQEQYHDPFSWAGYNTTFTQIESFIAMGGTLQTMVPALSLMLLYGSVHTAINLANGAQKGGGSEGANAVPKTAAPANAGKMSHGNTNSTFNAQTGGFQHASTGGSETVVGGQVHSTTAAVNQAHQNSVGASSQRMHQTTDQLQQSISKMAQQFEKSSDGKGFNVAEGSQHLRGLQAMSSWSKVFSEQNTETEGSTLSDAFILSGGAGLEAQAQLAAKLGFGMDFVKSTNEKAGVTEPSSTTGDDNTPGQTKQGGKSNDRKLGVAAKAGLEGGLSANAKVNTAVQVNQNESNTSGLSNVTSSGENNQVANTGSESNSKSQGTTKSNQKGQSTDNAWGSNASEVRASAQSWSNTRSDIATENKMAAISQGSNSQLQFTMTGMTSDNASNKTIQSLENGSWMRNSDHAVMQQAMSPEDTKAFNKFKTEGGYAPGKDGDISAFKDFAKTDAGDKHADLADNLNTSRQHQERYLDFMKENGALTSSKGEYNAAAVRFADQEFGRQLNDFEEHKFAAAGAMLEEGNRQGGGNFADWKAAADHFKGLDKLADKELSSPPVNQEGRDKAAVKPEEVATKIAAAQTATTKTGNEIDKADANTHFNPAQPPATPKLPGDVAANATKLDQKVESGTADAKKLDEKTAGMQNAREKAEPIINKALDTTAGFVSGVAEWVNGSEREQVGERLVKGGAGSNTAQIMTGGDGSHDAIRDRVAAVSNGGANNSDRKELLDTLIAKNDVQAAANEIISSDKPSEESRTLANDMMKNVNSVNEMMGSSSISESDKQFYQGLSDAVADGSMTRKEAFDALELAKGDHNVQPNGFVHNFDGFRNDIEAGHKAMDMMKEKGLENTDNYRQLESRVQTNEQWLKNNEDKVALNDAVRAYSNVTNDHGDMRNEYRGNNGMDPMQSLIHSDVGNLLNSAIKGDGATGEFSRMNLNEALAKTEERGFMESLMLGDTSQERNNDQVGRYSEMRQGLEAAQQKLEDVGNTQAAERVGQVIEQLDQASGMAGRYEGMQEMRLDSNETSNGTEVSRESFNQLHSARDNQEVEINGQSYHKAGSSDDGNGNKSVILEHTNSGGFVEQSSLSMNSDGSGDLSVTKDIQTQGASTLSTVSRESGENITPAESGIGTTAPGQQGGENATPAERGTSTSSPIQQGGENTTPAESGTGTTAPGQQGVENATPAERGTSTSSPIQQGGENTTPAESGTGTTAPG
ncbi:conjugal transfer protein TraG N-terminal domain-containing protein, partial [Vibrio sp. 10N.286.45.B6]